MEPPCHQSPFLPHKDPAHHLDLAWAHFEVFSPHLRFNFHD